ncbi:MAG: hypothetical protein HYU99_01105 [Deltaproteobacteria bacterium]|nr:hypothetical protein [Deltaproteobacteria bacterium]
MTELTLLDTGSLPEFFRERVSTSMQDLRIKASPQAEFYLVNLLVSFAQTEKLYERNENGELVDSALAVLFLEGMSKTASEKIPLLKKTGDIALYVSGFFSDSFFRKVINIDYYIRMGGSAYSSVSQLVEKDPARHLSELFGELAVNFIPFMDVISEVADASGMKSDQNLLKLYEKWLKTGSERTRELLVREGIIPNETVKTKFAQ